MFEGSRGGLLLSAVSSAALGLPTRRYLSWLRMLKCREAGNWKKNVSGEEREEDKNRGRDKERKETAGEEKKSGVVMITDEKKKSRLKKKDNSETRRGGV